MYYMKRVPFLKGELFLHLVDVVEFLPSEELDSLGVGASIDEDGDLANLGLATEVSIGSCRLVDGVLQLKTLDDGVGSHIENLEDLLGNLAIGETDVARAIGVDIQSTGSAIPIAYATSTSTSSATPAATRFFATWRAA